MVPHQPGRSIRCQGGTFLVDRGLGQMTQFEPTVGQVLPMRGERAVSARLPAPLGYGIMITWHGDDRAGQALGQRFGRPPPASTRGWHSLQSQQPQLQDAAEQHTQHEQTDEKHHLLLHLVNRQPPASGRGYPGRAEAVASG
jgi:hypothetical protein